MVNLIRKFIRNKGVQTLLILLGHTKEEGRRRHTYMFQFAKLLKPIFGECTKGENLESKLSSLKRQRDENLRSGGSEKNIVKKQVGLVNSIYNITMELGLVATRPSKIDESATADILKKS